MISPVKARPSKGIVRPSWLPGFLIERLVKAAMNSRNSTGGNHEARAIQAFITPASPSHNHKTPFSHPVAVVDKSQFG
jgi:hypothetical protein